MTTLEQAYEEYKKNKLSRKSWLCMAESLLAEGRREEAVLFASLLHRNGGNISSLSSLTEKDFYGTERGRDFFRLALMNVSHTPLTIDIYDDAGQNVGLHYRSCVGNFLPGEYDSDNMYRYYCGVYNEGDFINEGFKRLKALDRAKEFSPYRYDNIPFDVMRAQSGNVYQADFGQQTVVLPLAATGPSQRLCLSDGKMEQSMVLGQYEFRMVRVKGKIKITSDGDFLWGEPIVLRHDSKRHRLVLNILLDSLSWAAVREDHYKDVPHLKKFFEQGLIFDEAYSPAEYTFPSLNAMSTGKYMHHSGIIDEGIYAPCEAQTETLSAQMKAQGYYCVNIMGDGRGLMTGAMRGFDRLIINPYLENYTNIGVRRTIDHLEAFNECDNYVFLHISDPHPFSNTIPVSLPTQTKTPWQEMSFADSPREAALRLTSTDFFKADNRYMIRRMDEELGRLFRYIEDNYGEDEYIVNVFSDHGVSIYTDEQYFFKDTQCHVALMCRGAGIPMGKHSQELVNGIDLYAIMARECGFMQLLSSTDANLPAAFGGQEREIIYSNSIFPGQTYKLCMRTRDYECRLETKAVVSLEGRINIDDFTMQVYTRGKEHSIVEDSYIKNYFIDKAAEFLVGLVEEI
ncbi:sulfatase-like hydrolase/transferase [Selenomonas ruminantium]|nr:sulfatase-like hydrolase/transferase [Selenomonas ruminantium]